MKESNGEWVARINKLYEESFARPAKKLVEKTGRMKKVLFWILVVTLVTPIDEILILLAVAWFMGWL